MYQFYCHSQKYLIVFFLPSQRTGIFASKYKPYYTTRGHYLWTPVLTCPTDVALTLLSFWYFIDKPKKIARHYALPMRRGKREAM